ncbi:L,D-transpeptidase family protein [Anaerocolumna sp.]|uniref:L,D-transpeptidase family protein n=1 Tax=Anaerocolumna sp. TaxID=2041569 RepID=UPI0028AAB16B|nr:L,D-transpeptidase family protein [Anaerocolumna sp.]
MAKQILKQNSKRNYKKKLFFLGLTGLFLVLLLTYLIISSYYDNHFYNNTIINGVRVSNMTVEQAEKAINEEVRSYLLPIYGRNNERDVIFGDDINLHAIFDGSLSSALEEQNSFKWPFHFIRTDEIEVNALIEHDDSLLQKVFDKLKFFKEEMIIEPQNAYISEYGENGYEILPEELGAKVKKDALFNAVKKAIDILEPSLSIEDVKAYEEPKITSENPKLVAALNEMNKIASSKITYNFGEDIEILDSSKISEWLSVNKKYEVNLDAEGVKEFVDYIGWAYNTFGKTRTFTTSYGDVIEVRGGDYGWWLNRGKEVSELTELLLEGKQLVKEPSYFQTAMQYGKDDVGDTYVEVNLTAQHLFFYKEGKLVLETDFVSGNLSKNYGTPVGTYSITYKENDATLKGENYATPVKYWMPFNGNIGFHDAPWRKEFGKDIYMKQGSHGCVNMPPALAKELFENISKGMPVIVYELEGTENHGGKDNQINIENGKFK